MDIVATIFVIIWIMTTSLMVMSLRDRISKLEEKLDGFRIKIGYTLPEVLTDQERFDIHGPDAHP